MTPGIDDLIGKEFGGGSRGERKDESRKERSGKLSEDEEEFSREHGFSGSSNDSGNGNGKKKNGNSGKNKQQKGEDEKLPKHSIYKYSNKRRDDLHSNE